MSESLMTTCPSDLVLDRHALGELDGSLAGDLEEHLSGCACCRDRVAVRDGGFSALAVDGDRLFARIAQAADRPDRPRRHTGALFVLPLAAAAAWLFAMPAEPDVQSKGGASLRVFREHDGRVEEALSGSPFAAGDRLRFMVNSEHAQIMIVGAEASGETYVFYPPGEARSGLPETRPDGALIGAVELDDYRGREWVHLVECDRPFGRASLQVRGGRVKAPNGCRTATVETTRALE